MPPGLTSPSIMWTSGTAPPSGVKLSWAESTAPVEVPVVEAANRPDIAVPKRISLPSMLPPIGSDRLELRVAGVLEMHGEAGGSGPDREHDREQHPALALVLDEAPVGVGERERDHQQDEDLEQVREAVRVLERVGGVGVVGPAAVLAQLLDRLLARDRAAGDRLGDALHGRGVGEAVEVLHDALAREHDRDDDRERQQHPDRAPREIDPEVADRRGAAADEAPDQRDGDGEADGGREEVLHGEPGHLGEVAHRQLAAVVLPVRVGDEARPPC